MKQLFIALNLFTLSLFAGDHPFLERTIPSRVQIATNVLASRMQSGRPVPSYLYRNAKCIASIRMVKAGFIWGGEASTGLVSCRLPNGDWSAPSFLNLGGVSWGLQIGLQFVDSVLLFMNDYSVSLLRAGGRIELGGNVSFAAGPFGEGAGVGFTPQAAVLNYQQASGLFAGISFNGLVLSPGLVRNEIVYGRGATQNYIMSMPALNAPLVVQEFSSAVRYYDR